MSAVRRSSGPSVPSHRRVSVYSLVGAVEGFAVSEGDDGLPAGSNVNIAAKECENVLPQKVNRTITIIKKRVAERLCSYPNIQWGDGDGLVPFALFALLDCCFFLEGIIDPHSGSCR